MDDIEQQVMADLDAIGVPKRKRPRRAEVTDQIGDASLPHVHGVMLVRDADGWRCVEVRLLEHTLASVAVHVGEPDAMAIAVGQCESRLHEIAERIYDAPPLHTLAARKDGIMTPERAEEDWRTAVADMSEAFWAGAHPEAEASLRAYARTGRLEPASIGREPTAEDRCQLQELLRLQERPKEDRP